MSFVSLQIGQCGNQLGRSFFDTLSEVLRKPNSANAPLVNDAKHKFFFEDNKKTYARSVLIDTEPKVIEGITKFPKDSYWYYYRENAIHVYELGSGNNWAMGYHGNGLAAQEAALNAVRLEVERCDYLTGFLQFSSAAGGTGSGIGSFLSETLQDEYPSTSSASIIVMPFQKGDVTVQAYNCILSLSHLQKSSDILFLFENDWLMKLCCQKMGIKAASMFDINKVASEQLVNILLPVEKSSQVIPTFNDLLSHLVPHPQFKLVGLRSVPQEPLTSLPFSAHTWSGLLRSLRRMILYNTVIEEVYGRYTTTSHPMSSPPVSLANLLVLRGRDCDTADAELLHKSSLPYATWVPNTLRLRTWMHPMPFLQYDRTAVLANNGQLSIPCIDSTVAKAWKMFSCRAYFHHYEQCGLSMEDFKLSVMDIEQLISSYNSLAV